MDCRQFGVLSLSFTESKITQPSYFSHLSPCFLKITFGHQHFVTSHAPIIENYFKCLDSLKFIKTNEETLKIECFSRSSTSESKIGSAIFPIQPAIKAGIFKGKLLLMSINTVVMHLSIELKFEERIEFKADYPIVVYPLPPPDHPHVHAFAIPPNFIYTPPGYYQASNLREQIFN